MENASLTMRSSEVSLRSHSALNSLLHEAQHQVEELNSQLRRRDNVIGELKAQLGKYERISINVEEKETVSVGPSRSLIESLCQEICKLKKRINELELKASQQDERSQQEVQRLRVLLAESERELQNLRSSPGRRQDQAVQGLRCCLEAQRRHQATEAVLRASLAEEADRLRVQLGVAVLTCQGLMARLEGRGQEEEEAGPEQTPHQHTPQEVPEACGGPEACGVPSEATAVRRLKEDNRRLRQRLAHVESLNAKWQRYDSSREDYVRVLCQRLREYGAQASAASNTPTPTPTPTSTSTSTPTSRAGPGLLLMQQEVTRLNVLLADKMDEILRLEETRRRNQEWIQTLEQQVLIYTDDFRWERADRERAQERIQALQEQLEGLQQELCAQDAEEAGLEARPVRGMVQSDRQISPRRHGQLLLRTGATPSPRQQQQQQQQHHQRTPPMPMQQHPEVAMATPGPAWELGPEGLLCPSCQTMYSDADAMGYLNHCHECADLRPHLSNANQRYRPEDH